MRKCDLILFLLLILLFFFSCENEVKSKNVLNLSASDAYALYNEKKANENFSVLDVRTESEYEAGHIPTATNININGADFNLRVKNLDKGKEYFIYCRSGNRSARAVAVFLKLGFTNIYHLKSGIRSWIANDYPIAKP